MRHSTQQQRFGVLDLDPAVTKKAGGGKSLPISAQVGAIRSPSSSGRMPSRYWVAAMPNQAAVPVTWVTFAQPYCGLSLLA